MKQRSSFQAVYSKYSLTIFLIFISTFLKAQKQETTSLEKPFRNYLGVYLGIIDFNINYEGNIGIIPVNDARNIFNIRMGFGYYHIPSYVKSSYLNPVLVYLVGKANSFCELNVGCKIMLENNNVEGRAIMWGSTDDKGLHLIFPDVYVGYRYERRQGIYFRAGTGIIDFIAFGMGYKF